MMISLYVGSPLGQPFVKCKCGAEGLIAAIISGVAGLGAAGISASSNAANVSAAADLNEENRKWQSAEAQKARNWSATEWQRQHGIQVLDWQRQFDAQTSYGREMMERSSDLQHENWLKQFNLQNEYASPESQISRLQKAGLNPALALGGSSSSGLMSAPSTPLPSAGSPPSPSVPVPSVPNIQASTPQTFLPRIDTDWATKVLDTLSSTAERLTKAGVNKTEIEKSIATFSSYVEKARNEVEIQNLMKTSQSISNYISERTKDMKVGKEYGELQKLWKEMTYLGSQIEVNRVLKDNYEADTDLKRMQEVLAQMQSNKAFQESELLSYQVGTYYEDFTNRQNMYKAQTALDSANAFKARAEGLTENQLRDVRKSLLEVQEVYTDLQSKGVALDNLFKDKSFQARVKSVIEQANQAGLVTQQESVELAQQLYQYDIRKINQFFDWLGKGVGAYRDAGIGTSAFGGFKPGSKSSFDPDAGKGFIMDNESGLLFKAPWSK